MPARLLLLLAFLALGGMERGLGQGTEVEKITYHAQLIRGSNDPKPPEPNAKPVGPKVALLLRPFAWSNYWKMAHREVHVTPGKKTRVPLNGDREVEIDLTKKDRPKFTAFYKGNPIASANLSVDQTLSVIGGDREENTAWFIIVKRTGPGK